MSALPCTTWPFRPVRFWTPANPTPTFSPPVETRLTALPPVAATRVLVPASEIPRPVPANVVAVSETAWAEGEPVELVRVTFVTARLPEVLAWNPPLAPVLLVTVPPPVTTIVPPPTG